MARSHRLLPFPSRAADICRRNTAGTYRAVYLPPGPHDFHGVVYLPRDLDCADDTIDLRPAAKPTTDQMMVNHDLVQRKPRGFRRCGLGSPDDLAADPDFAAVLADMNGAVHWLQGRVREERNLVHNLDLRDGVRHRPVGIADIRAMGPNLSVALSSSPAICSVSAWHMARGRVALDIDAVLPLTLVVNAMVSFPASA
jgi:hypothetical protein